MILGGREKVKRNLLKALGISFLIFAVLSWVIPVGTYTSGKLTTSNIAPIGLVDLINKPISAVVTFALYGVVFAVIGGFYGVVNKTGVLEKISEKMANSFKGKENKFLIITVILFTVLSSVTGLVIPLFVLVPLFAAILFKMNYDKVTALAATVGGLLVGNVASTYGFNITGYTKNLLSLDMNNQIVARLILLCLLTVLLAVTVISVANRKSAKKEVKKAAKEEPKKVSKVEPKKAVKKAATKKKTTAKKGTKKSNTRALAVTKPVKKVSDRSKLSAAPFVVILVIMLILAMVAMYNWYYSFNVKVFNDAYEAVMGVKIQGFKIFENLFSGLSQLGYWSNLEFTGLLIITSMIIAKVYKLSLNEYVESFIAGVKKWLPTAIYATLASVILVVLYQALQAGSGTLVDTINGKIFGLVDGFNPITTGVSTLVSSFFYNDLYYLLATMSSFVSGYDAAAISNAGLIIQSVYGVAMLIFPTSAILIAGLSIFDVSYKKWVKYIW